MQQVVLKAVQVPVDTQRTQVVHLHQVNLQVQLLQPALTRRSTQSFLKQSKQTLH